MSARKSPPGQTAGIRETGAPYVFRELPTLYTIPQCRAGGRISGESRRYLVRGRHAEVRELHHAGHSNGMIARITGYHRSTVGRILKGIIRTCLTAWEATTKAIAYPLRHVLKNLTLSKDCSRNTPSRPAPKVRRKSNKPAPAWLWWRWKIERMSRPDLLRALEQGDRDDKRRCEGIHAGLVGAATCPYCGWNFQPSDI